MLPYIEVATTLVRARALENGVAIAYANQIGKDQGLTYTGQSYLVGPDGRDIRRAGESL
jgi:5-aminopentanamidase